MGFFSWKKKPKYELILFSERDQEAYENMIRDRIGSYETVFHEIVSPDLHIDVIPIPPSEKRNYYTLLTMGMGAYQMPVPSGYGRMNRAELAIRLPADWDICSNDEKWYWPIGLLKDLARMPYYQKTWLGYGHDVDFGDAFSEETELCAVLLDIFDDSIEPLTLENGDQLVIYNVIPIYRQEMEYKNEHDAEALLEKMTEETIHGPLNLKRASVI